ncbi:non-ribosomal peptide synthetase [Chitinophaga sp. MD30]|uniref:non-ribosomal peptide synthetase n=1 Tax=Chitinophaga sp. MD30 TaxID=2033437 RepID=UPI000BAF0884|nr:non-ribosomal peptide synthetase [Chitinophaga sp. MD30]ASZ13238.1 non-ribosomal peptide synthetase [Chitinophaga sp. MD30]
MSGFNLEEVVGLLEKAQDFGIRISYDDDGLIVQSQSTKEIDRLFLHELKNSKQHLIAYFKEQARIVAGNEKIPVFPRDKNSRLPLSYSQERLWFVDQLEGSVQYHVPAAIRLKGALNIPALEQALSAIVDRHEVLRSVIREDSGQAYQYILDKGSWQLQHLDGSRYQNDENGLKVYIADLLHTPFNLAQDHMLRAFLIALGNDEHVLVMAMHHIASDGWSISVLVKEFVAFYGAFSEGGDHGLADLEVQFADYAIWQRKFLEEDGVMEQQLNYWRKQLEGVTPLQLPTDFERPFGKSTRGALASFLIEKRLSDALNRLSKQQEATLYMTLLAAFKVLLYRYSGQEDICVGGAIAGRMKVELEELIGFFVNSIVIRSNLGGKPTFNQLLQQVRTTTLDAYEHQDVPFEKVVEAVLKERDTSKNPLFQVIFVLQNGEKVPELRMGDLVMQDEPITRETSQFDQNWSIEERPDGIAIDIEYSIDVFKSSTIERIFRHYVSLLEAIVKNADQSIDTLPLIDDNEKIQLLQVFNDTATLYPEEKTVTALFADQVKRTPDHIAVAFEQQHLTYLELDLRANQVAHYLIANGIKPGDKVGLLSYRGLDMISGMLGILKSGAAYVPFHIDYPGERLKVMIEDAGITHLLYTDGVLYADRDLADVVEGLPIEDAWMHSIATIDLQSGNDSCVYIMYTSGTTGRPKGIAVSHKNITKLVFDSGPIAVRADDTVLQWSNYAFDGSTYDIYSAFLKGAKLYLIQDKQASDAFELARIIESENITVWFVTTALFNNIVDSAIDSLTHLRKLLFGGEKVSLPHVSRALAVMGAGKLTHVYGPTETTTYATSYAIDSTDASGTVPIGRPLSNSQGLILDTNGQLVPIGVSGELYIGGDGVAIGYVNNEAMTADKFVTLPYAPGRWYRTGDRTRWLDNGVIEYVGRVDDQVKIRGYRIEPGEIATVLRQSDYVQDAIVIVDAPQEGEKRLLGYIVPAGDYEQEAILEYLQERLPAYMIPAHLIPLEAFPLNVNGKIDKRALPMPVISSEEEYVAPRNSREQALSDIWSELLGVEQVSIHTNFFEAGGHSLLAIRLISAIRKALEIEIPISYVFDYPTIALFIDKLGPLKETARIPDIVKEERPAQIPLSFNQERLWFIDQLEGSVQYHVPETFRLKGKLNRSALAAALNGIVNRHESLRTIIKAIGGVPHQLMLPENSWQLEVIDQPIYRENATALSEQIQAFMVKPFDLAADHMLRAHLVVLGEEEHILVINIHHIVSDGWSIGVLVQELVELYKAAEAGSPSTLAPLELQYADFSIWQRKYLSGDNLGKQLDYWNKQLSGVPVLQLPTDHARPAIQSSRGGVSDYEIDPALTAALNALAQQQGTTLFMTLLSAFNVLLYRYSGQDDICVGTSIAGRTRKELEGLIGFFVNTLALRNDLSGNPTFAQLLQGVKRSTLDAYAHQETPFEKVVETVVKDRDLSRNPLFQVMFELQNTPEVPDLRLGQVQLLKEEVEHTTAQFDLIVSMEEAAGRLTWYAEYSADLFEPTTIDRMMAHFEQLLRSIVAQPQTKINDLKMLGDEEEQELLYTFNNTATSYPQESNAIAIFEAVAAATPDAIALVFGNQQISYGSLNTRSSQLAHYLRQLGVTTDTLVPLCVGRSVDMIVAILAIWKAGGAYIPVDPTFPADRIHYMIQDSDARVVVTEDALRNQLELSGIQVIALDADNELIAQQPANTQFPPILAGQLAYMIYTSGSTGTPKGVLIEHAGMLNHLYAKINELELDNRTVVAFTASYTFDISVWQMFTALLCGGRTVVYSTELIFQPSALLQSVADEKVTVLELVPSYLSSLLQLKARVALSDLKYLLVTGETVSQAVLAQWFSHPAYGNIPVVNAYGPTEASDDITHHFMYEAPVHPNVPLGKTIQNLSIYVRDIAGQLSPVGVPGEICVSGIGVGRGYFKRPELTAERFIQDPFRNDNTRMYRTGDLGRWLHDGTLEHLGRMDDQVKVRGYRIELGEVEAAITQSSLVTQAAVLVKKDERDHAFLAAYIVPAEQYDKETLTAYLKDTLPEYMVPAIVVPLDEMPLTRNGKIDKQKLNEIETVLSAKVAYVAPQNETEEKLENICTKLLGVTQIGVYDDLFELGMHSLLVMRLAAAVEDAFSLQVSVRTFFQLTNISALAKYIAVQQFTPATASGNRKTKTIEL